MEIEEIDQAIHVSTQVKRGRERRPVVSHISTPISISVSSTVTQIIQDHIYIHIYCCYLWHLDRLAVEYFQERLLSKNHRQHDCGTYQARWCGAQLSHFQFASHDLMRVGERRFLGHPARQIAKVAIYHCKQGKTLLTMCWGFTYTYLYIYIYRY